MGEAAASFDTLQSTHAENLSNGSNSVNERAEVIFVGSLIYSTFYDFNFWFNIRLTCF